LNLLNEDIVRDALAKSGLVSRSALVAFADGSQLNDFMSIGNIIKAGDKVVCISSFDDQKSDAIYKASVVPRVGDVLTVTTILFHEDFNSVGFGFKEGGVFRKDTNEEVGFAACAFKKVARQ
jgi:hypothetical protein